MMEAEVCSFFLVAACRKLLSKNQIVAIFVNGNVSGNMAMSSNNEHVRGGVNKALLNCISFYRIQLNKYLSFNRLWSGFIIVSRQGRGDGIDNVT